MATPTVPRARVAQTVAHHDARLAACQGAQPLAQTRGAGIRSSARARQTRRSRIGDIGLIDTRFAMMSPSRAQRSGRLWRTDTRCDSRSTSSTSADLLHVWPARALCIARRRPDRYAGPRLGYHFLREHQHISVRSKPARASASMVKRRGRRPPHLRIVGNAMRRSSAAELRDESETRLCKGARSLATPDRRRIQEPPGPGRSVKYEVRKPMSMYGRIFPHAHPDPSTRSNAWRRVPPEADREPLHVERISTDIFSSVRAQSASDGILECALSVAIERDLHLDHHVTLSCLRPDA